MDLSQKKRGRFEEVNENQQYDSSIRDEKGIFEDKSNVLLQQLGIAPQQVSTTFHYLTYIKRRLQVTMYQASYIRRRA